MAKTHEYFGCTFDGQQADRSMWLNHKLVAMGVGKNCNGQLRFAGTTQML